jgi:hypothetical protein
VKIDGATDATYIVPSILGVTKYRCVISNEAGGVTSSTVTLTPKTPALITTQPKTIYCQDDANNLRFSVIGKGEAPLTYQWYQGAAGNTSSPIVGGTASKLAVPTVEGSYWCRVSNEFSTADSMAASVVFAEKPSIVVQPISQEVAPGASAILTVGSNGGYLSYQWFIYSPTVKKYIPIEGATAATFTTGSIYVPTNFYCRVSNAKGAKNTRSVKITPTFWIGSQPKTIFCKPSAKGLRFSVAVKTAKPGEPLTYQWYQGNVGDMSMPISGGTSSVLTVATAETSLWCRISDGTSAVSSVRASVIFAWKPSIELQPVRQRIVAGTSATLSISATGNYLNYQWFIYSPTASKYIPIEGATAATFTTGSVTTEAAFYCKISNPLGNIKSNVVKVSPF